MNRLKAMKYLKYLHGLESEYRKSLTTLELALLIEQVRLEFVAAYREQ